MCFTTDPSFSEFLRLLNIHPHSYVLKILSCEHPLLPYITHHEIPGSSSSRSVMDALSVIENLLWLQNSLLFLTLAQSVNTRKEAYILLLLPHYMCVVLFDSCDSRVHLMNMSGHGDIFRCRSCWSDVLVGHVVLPTPPPSPHTH